MGLLDLSWSGGLCGGPEAAALSDEAEVCGKGRTDPKAPLTDEEEMEA